MAALVDWEMLSDQNKYEESYGEESNYDSETESVDELAGLMDTQ